MWTRNMCRTWNSESKSVGSNYIEIESHLFKIFSIFLFKMLNAPSWKKFELKALNARSSKKFTNVERFASV